MLRALGVAARAPGERSSSVSTPDPARSPAHSEPLGSVTIVGAGVVGEALASRLREADPARGLRLTARSDASVARLSARGFDVRPLDVVQHSADALESAIGAAACVVFSAAAGRGGDYRSIYAGGTAKLAEFCTRRRAHLVYTSSTGVYAEHGGEWVDEDAALAEDDERTRALTAAEQHVLEAGGAVLRLSGILATQRGPHQRLDALAATRRDDGEAWLNLVPLPTIVDALVAVIERRWRGVVNVSGARPWRRREFYDALLLRAGRSPIDWTEPAAPIDRGRRVRVDRLRQELGVVPRDLDLAWLLP